MRTRLLAQSTLGLALLFGTPALSHAYSLGEIRITSMLGESFFAEIPLNLRPGENIKEITVSLASQEEYTVLELHRSPATVLLDVKVRHDTRGSRIVMKSDSPIQEPFFNLLLKTASGSGSHYRNFPVFLDIKKTPQMQPGKEPLPRKPAVVQEVSPSGGKGRKPRDYQPGAPTTTAGVGGDYGPVRNGETLLHIARQVSGNYPGITEGQLAAAIWRRNPGAFYRGNINLLRAGAVLSLPTSDEAHKFSLQETRDVLAQQNRQRQEEVAARPQTTRKAAAKAEKPPADKPVTPPAEEKRPASALPAKELRRQESKVGQTTEQSVGSPPKTTFEQRVVLQAGEGSPGVATAADKPTASGQSGAIPPAPPTDQVAPDPLTLQLTKSLSRLESLEGKLNEATNALQNSEKARNKLQSNMDSLQQRMTQLEKEKAESEWSLEDMLLYAGGGLGVLILGGVLALFSRRRKPTVSVAKGEAAPTLTPEPAGGSHLGMAMAGMAGGAAVVAATAMAHRGDTSATAFNLAKKEDEDAIVPFSPSDYHEEEETEVGQPFGATSQEDLDEPFPNADDLGNLSEDTGSSWKSALGVEEEAPADFGGADMDLDAMQGDLDLDQFAVRTVVGLGGEEHAFLENNGEDGLMLDGESLDQGEELGAGGLDDLLPFSSPAISSKPPTRNSMEELDFSALDELGNDQEATGINNFSDENEMDSDSLFRPGASFDEDESEEEFGTLEATPISRGPGLAIEEGGLESLDLASLGLDDEEETPFTPAKASVDLDLDSISFGDDLSLGNFDDGLSIEKPDSGKAVDVPSFDVVEMDFAEEETTAKKIEPPPKAGEYELTILDFDLEEEKK